MVLDANYWEQTYQLDKTGWDIGYAATPIKEYIDQLTNKNLKILIPGAGNAYEVEYLFNAGFKNTYLLDFAETPINNFKNRLPEFPNQQLICENFFDHCQQYDMIIEHTFLTSLPRNLRKEYAQKMSTLLFPNGKLIGLLFNHEFGNPDPPYGGTIKEYEQLFEPYFHFTIFESSTNSIKPRMGKELFILLTKK